MQCFRRLVSLRSSTAHWNRLDYMQEQGLMSSLPLANNLVPIKRALTTTSTAIFVPFTTQELFMALINSSSVEKFSYCIAIS